MTQGYLRFPRTSSRRVRVHSLADEDVGFSKWKTNNRGMEIPFNFHILETNGVLLFGIKIADGKAYKQRLVINSFRCRIKNIKRGL